MQEQWLSNPEFRADPVNRISAMIKPLVDQGFVFRENFARDQVALLCKNEAALKTQFSLIFPYVVIMKALLSKKMPLDEALRQLDRLGQADRLLLPILRQHRYKFVGTPAVVTGDKVLHRLIMRVLPPRLHESQQACFSILPEGMEDMQWKKILQVVESVQIRANFTATQRSQRMKALFELAKEFCSSDEERAQLDEGWAQWCLPGLARGI